MPRPIGTRLREVCEIVEREGPVRLRQIAGYMDCTDKAVTEYLRRAVKHGMLMVAKVGKFNHWTTVPGWRDRADWGGKQVKVLVEPVVLRPITQEAHFLHSIWK